MPGPSLEEVADDHAFATLPDLFPEVFHSYCHPQHDVKYSNADYSTYRFWESSCNEISFRSHDEGADSCLYPGAIDGERTDSSLHVVIPQSNSTHSPEVNFMTRTEIAERENLRLIPAGSTHSFMDIDREVDSGSEVDSHESDICVDTYLQAQEEESYDHKSECLHLETGDSTRDSTNLGKLQKVLPQAPPEKTSHHAMKKAVRQRKVIHNIDSGCDVKPAPTIKKKRRSSLKRPKSSQSQNRTKRRSETGSSNVVLQDRDTEASSTNKGNAGPMFKRAKQKTVSVSQVLPDSVEADRRRWTAEQDTDMQIKGERTQFSQVSQLHVNHFIFSSGSGF